MYFTTPKTKWYGDGAEDDSNIGTGAGKQIVVLQRVPNYYNLAVNGTFTANAFDGYKYGLVAFRAAGTLSGTGTIHANGLGYAAATGYASGAKGSPNSNGGGGGYATDGNGPGGGVYGQPPLEKLFFGSGGGQVGDWYVGFECENNPPSYWCFEYMQSGPGGASGGGMMLIAAQSVNFQGTLSAQGASGSYYQVTSSYSGGGAGGSIRLESHDISLNSADASGGGGSAGGNGRIAVYYSSSQSITNINPAAYIGILGQSGTAAPTSTPITFSTPSFGGTGNDGDLTVSAGNTFNINTNYSSSRTCADGVAYNVIELSTSYAKLSAAPTSNCILIGDEVLIVHVNGSGANTGNYEFLRVGGIIGDTIYFTTPKTKWYGSNAEDDSNVGMSTGQQRVVLQRVPNYDNLTVNGTLTANAYDGYKYGLIAFRVAGTLSGNGTINADALGFAAGTGYGIGAKGGANSHGGGGGYGTNGSAPAGGSAYGDQQLTKIFYGSGGGAGGDYYIWTECGPRHVPCFELISYGPPGGRGAGIIYIGGETISFQGTVSAKGNYGTYAYYGVYGGGGAGGSIRIDGSSISVPSADVSGGYYGGGFGRTAVYYYNSFTGNFTPGYLEQVDPNSTSTPTLTVTPTGATLTATATNTMTPIPTAVPTGWQLKTYTYSETIPHAVTLVSSPSVTNMYEYDANGNMTCREEEGVTYVQTYNLENRIAGIAKLASGTCASPGDYVTKWDFAYDGDGTHAATLITPYESGVPQTPQLTAYYFGGAYEVTGTEVKKYYSFAGQTIAMKDANGLQYFLTDHLGSVVGITDSSGTLTSEQRYLPFGQERTDVGTISQTDYGYTGQRDLGMGLMDYKARFYSSYITRFSQPDSIVPDPSNPQTWNRYSYVYNRPINLNDPTGHCGEGSSPSEGITQEDHDWLCTIREEALTLSARVDADEITDVEALAQMTEFAAPHYQSALNIIGTRIVVSEDKEAFANDLGIVLGGNEYRGVARGAQQVIDDHGGVWGTIRDFVGGNIPLGEVAVAVSHRCRGTETSDGRLCQYYTGFSAFGTEGFKDEYSEKGSNQVAHFSGGLSAMSNGGRFGLNSARSIEDRDTADYRLYGPARDLYESNTRLDRWGDWIRRHIAE